MKLPKNAISADDATVTQMQTSSNMGAITYNCTATVANDTGKAIIFNFDNTRGVKCDSVNFDFHTTDWQETISANGNA